MPRDSVCGIDASPDSVRTRIVLADDHAIVRSALRALLEADAQFQVVAEAGDVDEFVRKVLAYKPDVIVLDLSMPGSSTLTDSSLTAIPRMLEASPETAVVVLTMENEPRFAREALRLGALGFVLKDAADAELVAAVHAALRGQRCLNPQLGGLIAAAPETPAGPPDNLPRGRSRFSSSSHSATPTPRSPSSSTSASAPSSPTALTSSRKRGARRGPSSSPTPASTGWSTRPPTDEPFLSARL